MSPGKYDPAYEQFHDFKKLDKDIRTWDWPMIVKPDGKPVPKHQTLLKTGQKVIVEDYTFKVAHVGESYVVLEPLGPIIIGEGKEDESG